VIIDVTTAGHGNIALATTPGGDIPCGAAAGGGPSSAHPLAAVLRPQFLFLGASLFRRVMTRAILIAISIALIAGGLYLTVLS